MLSYLICHDNDAERHEFFRRHKKAFLVLEFMSTRNLPGLIFQESLWAHKQA